MCDPISLTVASTAMQAYSGKKAADAQADVATQNAKLARDQANAVEERKAQQLAELQLQKQRTMGTQRVAMAGSGVDSSFGSGIDILSSTAYLAQQDMNNTEVNAANEKWGYQAQAANYDAQAGAARAAGKNNAIGTVLAGAGKVASMGSAAKAAPASQDTFFSSPTYEGAKAWSKNNQGLVSNKWYKGFKGGV